MSENENQPPAPSKQTSSVPLKKETVRVTLKAADAPPAVPSATVPMAPPVRPPVPTAPPTPTGGPPLPTSPNNPTSYCGCSCSGACANDSSGGCCCTDLRHETSWRGRLTDHRASKSHRATPSSDSATRDFVFLVLANVNHASGGRRRRRRQCRTCKYSFRRRSCCCIDCLSLPTHDGQRLDQC